MGLNGPQEEEEHMLWKGRTEVRRVVWSSSIEVLVSRRVALHHVYSTGAYSGLLHPGLKLPPGLSHSDAWRCLTSDLCIPDCSCLRALELFLFLPLSLFSNTTE